MKAEFSLKYSNSKLKLIITIRSLIFSIISRCFSSDSFNKSSVIWRPKAFQIISEEIRKSEKAVSFQSPVSERLSNPTNPAKLVFMNKGKTNKDLIL